MAKKSPFQSNSAGNDDSTSRSSRGTGEIQMVTPGATQDQSALRAEPKKPRARKAGTALNAAPLNNTVPINLEEEIRRRAYELSAERGFSSGHETEDWLKAEREVMQRYGQVRTA
jgi:hypothetical protein